MSQEDLHIVILAAGKGTRMRSKIPKVLHKLAGLSLLEYTLNLSHQSKATSVTVVLSPDQMEIESLIKTTYPFVQIAFQKNQRGTGDAVLAAKNQLDDLSGTVLILFADTPLLRLETLQRLSTHRQKTSAAITVLAVDAPNHPGYGRLIIDEKSQVQRIVEMKDATDTERAVPLCNSGLMACDASLLLSFLASLTPENQAREYYLTDIVQVARSQGNKVSYIQAEDPSEVMGINTRLDLAKAEEVMQNRLRKASMLKGVTLLDPSSVYFSYDTKLSEDVVVHPHVYFGIGVRVDSDVTLHSFSHLEGAYIKSGASVGPFARLRPDTVLEEKTRVGNFVELKKTRLGKGSKANHLSYLGDAEIGEGCNIGAGTITCNYNGYQKYQTILEKGAFVGSNTTLIAPITVKEGAYIGAGTVVTKNVTSNALALSRSPQVEREGGANSLRRRFTQTQKKTS
tara:strand:+ start:2021 stop:3385 length:1365 start_codon:yes stop_codon:yes gene_type:complete